MLVYMGVVEGMVSGAIHSTASTVRPALQIIKTEPGVSKTSGAFLMVKGEERYIFGDCAINIDPDAQTLAEIAINSARTAKMFGIDPKVAMLSYSTKVLAQVLKLIRWLKQLKLLKNCVQSWIWTVNCNLMLPLSLLQVN